MMNISPQRGLPEIGPKSRRKERCSETISTVITISSIYRRCDSRVYVHDQVRTPPKKVLNNMAALSVSVGGLWRTSVHRRHNVGAAEAADS